jgi:hypothetical protein
MCDRWISDYRLRYIDDDVSSITSIYEFLDFLIDAYLWHLPIPRFSRQFDPAKSSNRVCNSNTHFINVLRDTKISEDVHAYVVVLMILDYDTLQQIPTKVAYETNFIECAQACISEDFHFVATSTLDFLQKFNAYMVSKKYEETFVKKPDDYLRLKDIDASLIADSYNEQMQHFINESTSGFSKKCLYEHCCVRNLVDEKPDFVFASNK